MEAQFVIQVFHTHKDTEQLKPCAFQYPGTWPSACLQLTPSRRLNTPYCMQHAPQSRKFPSERTFTECLWLPVM